MSAPPGPPRRRFPRYGPIVAVLIAGLVLPGAVLPSSGGAAPVPSPRSGGPGHPSVSVGPAASNGTLSTQYSIALRNDTIFPGNVLGASFTSPSYVTYDPGLRVFLVSCSVGVLELDPSTFGIVGTFESNQSAGRLLMLPDGLQLVVESNSAIDVYGAVNATLLAHIPVNTAGSGFDGTLVDIPYANEVVVGNEYGDELQVVNLTLGSLVTHFSVASSAVGLMTATYDPVNGYVFLPNYDNNEIQVIDSHGWTWVVNNTLSSSYFGFMMGILANPVTGTVYVTTAFDSSSFGTDYILQISGKNASVINSTGVGSYTSGMAYDPASNVLYVADSTHQVLYLLDGTNLSHDGSVGIPTASSYVEGQWWPLYVPLLQSVVLATGYQDSLAAIDAQNNTVYDSYTGAANPSTIAVDPVCGCYVVGNALSSTLDFYNESTFDLVDQAHLSGAAEGIVYDPWNQQLFVSESLSTRLQAIQILDASNGSYRSAIPTYAYPGVGTFDPVNGHLYFANDGGSTFLDVNGSNDSLDQEVGLESYAFPNGVTYVASTGDIWFSDTGQTNLSVVDPSNDTVTATIHVGSSPEGLAYDPLNDTVYAMIDGTQNLTELNASSGAVLGAVDLGYVDGLSVDPVTGRLYAVNDSSSVAVLNGTTVIGAVAAGTGTTSVQTLPGGEVLAGDEDNGFLYLLANRSGSYLTNAALQASPFLVEVNGTTTLHASSRGGTAPIGYTYSGLPPGCSPQNASALNCTPATPGQYTVHLAFHDAGGHAASASAHLWVLPAFRAWFNESGLPAGTNWTVHLTGQSNQTSPGQSVDFTLINGTYSYTVTTANSSYAAAGGTFTVNGGVVATRIDFVLVTFVETVGETGLPYDTAWYLNLTTGQSYESTSMGVLVTDPNGTYHYSARAPGGRFHTERGNFTVAGGPGSVSIAFSLVTFAVTFLEYGLPNGSAWTVELTDNNPLESSSGQAVGAIANGTYDYTAVPNDHRWHSLEGVLKVDGSAQNISLAFQPVLFDVDWAEVGLPNGATWGVQLPNLSGPVTSASGNISVQWTNGTYNYTVVPVAGYSPTAREGRLTVDGSAHTVAVTFVAYPSVVSFTADPSSFYVGNATELAADVHGGRSPYAYSYLTLPTGCTTVDAPSISCTPTEAGQYNVTVNVTDGLDDWATSTVHFTVLSPAVPPSKTGPNPPSIPPGENQPAGHPSTGIPVGVWIAAAVVVVLAGVGLLFVLRRRPPSSSSPDEPGTAG